MDKIKPGTDSPDQHNPVRRTLRRRLRSALKWFAVLVVLPILLGAIALSLFVNSSRFHSYLIATLQKQASDKLGVPVVLQNFTLHLSSLSVDLYGLTISGANPHPNPPLLEVQHIQAGVKIVSLVRRKWYIDDLRIDRPVIRIYVDPDGALQHSRHSRAAEGQQQRNLRSRNPPHCHRRRSGLLQRPAERPRCRSPRR